MILTGKEVAKQIIEKVKNANLNLTLAVFHPIEDKSAESYLKMKKKQLEKVNFNIKIFPVEKESSKEEFIKQLHLANKDETVTAIMVELPLPFKMNFKEIANNINPLKDVDGITFQNQGELFSTKQENLVPCTAMATIRTAEYYNTEIEGKNVLVIGRSNIVGLPLAKLFLNRNATVTTAHSKTKNLEKLIKASDIIAVATGKPGLVTSSMIKENATVFDIGINVDNNGKVFGDFLIEKEEDKEKINYTPVPRGIGVVTNAIMLENMVKCYELQKGENK
jgi:methylenetetrahydrofolate dehydrogenase (NADP+)/methenyltetrahydrofolate cyclohydrolase